MKARNVLAMLGIALLAMSVAACGGETATSATSQPSPSPSPTAGAVGDTQTVGTTVPLTERARMRVLLSPYAYVPANLPRGFVYIDWQHSDRTPRVAGELLTIDFAAPGGRQIVWTSSRACDTKGRVGPSATGYPGYGYGMTADRSTLIAGRPVYFSQGNHGSSAWTCFPLQTGTELDYVSVGIWESNCLTPAEAMRLVAHAVGA